MALNSGDQFAGFVIERMLGAGAMGEVYLARHPRLARNDALKILPAALTSDGEYRVRFNREADIAAALWHPHIVGVHDRGEYGGHLWISMDFVDGTDAARLLRDRPQGLPAREVLDIVDAVADALDFAHARRLLHRDVKPANILVTSAATGPRRIVLADFGIARRVDDVSLTATNMTLGTVSYAAPEQLMGEMIDGRADQYALAATAFHLLTGTELFPGTNAAVTIGKHLSAAPPRLSDVKPELAQLDSALDTALSKQPADRFESCRAFADALRKGTIQPATQLRPIVPPESQGPLDAPTWVTGPPTVAAPSGPIRDAPALAWSSESPAPETPNPYVLPQPASPPRQARRREPPPRRGSTRSLVIAIVVGGVAVALAATIAFVTWSGDEPGTATRPATSTRNPPQTSAQSSEPDSPTPTVQAPQPPSGANPTIADYIRQQGLTETTVRRGDPGVPTLTLPIPDGWEDAGDRTPEWAYSALMFADPAAAADPPTITAVMSKLTGNVDQASIFAYAPGELKNLPGYEGSPGGISDKQFGGFTAFQIGGTYVKDGVQRLVAQKTVVIPASDASGVYVLQLNANGTASHVNALANATALIDENTTIVP